MRPFREQVTEHHNKAIAVVMSCETQVQLDGAEQYCINLLTMHTRRINNSTRSQQLPYAKLLEESQQKLNLCIKHQRKKIRRSNK